MVHDKTIVSWAMAAKRGSYSEETLKEAVRLVQDEGYSYREVLKLTGIPRTTIHKYAKSTVVAWSWTIAEGQERYEEKRSYWKEN